MNNTFYCDMHCHPSLKSFGRSYPGDQNTPDSKKPSGIWHRDKPSLKTKFINVALTLTRFTQSDMTSLTKGRVKVIVASIEPIEKNFLTPLFGTGKLTDKLGDLISGIGEKKINFIQNNKDYFSELEKEYEYYLQLDNVPVMGKNNRKYQMVDTFSQIEHNSGDSVNDIISVVPSIEGCHVFTSNNAIRVDEQEALENIEKVKNWRYPPLFISIAHHFYNEYCGQAYSLNDTLKVLLDQKVGANSDFTELGYNAIKLLLDKEKGSRVLVDIKHMSRKSRRSYYKLLDSPAYKNENIPLIVSHGAVNGRPTVYSDDEHGAENGIFMGKDINFYDDELLKIARSKGLFCIQLDERNVASKSELKKIKFKILPHKMFVTSSKLVWNQIEYIAKVLDGQGEDAWSFIALGSDNDGIVNPLNGFWTSTQFPLLEKYLIRHAQKFLSSTSNTLSDKNKNLSASELMEKFFSGNAMDFLKRNLKT